VVKGYAEGTLSGLKPSEDNDRADSFRSAPFFARGRFISGNKSEHIYNAQSLAIYLGFTSKQNDKIRPANKVMAALNALELVELKELSYKQISEYENTKQMLSETTRLLQNRKSRLEKEKADAMSLSVERNRSRLSLNVCEYVMKPSYSLAACFAAFLHHFNCC
jgi:hypothetical protein